MARITDYKSLKPQVKDHHLISYNGEFYTLETFKKLCQQTKTWEYAAGTVQLYDKRNKTLSDPDTVEDPTPASSPEPVGQLPGSAINPLIGDLTPPEPPAQPLPDHSTPPVGFAPGPLPVELTTPQPPVATPPAPANDPS